MKINNFQGDLTDISAKKEALAHNSMWTRPKLSVRVIFTINLNLLGVLLLTSLFVTKRISNFRGELTYVLTPGKNAVTKLGAGQPGLLHVYLVSIELFIKQLNYHYQWFCCWNEPECFWGTPISWTLLFVTTTKNCQGERTDVLAKEQPRTRLIWSHPEHYVFIFCNK